MVMGDMEMKVDLAVIGSGPGGYAAAFRAADLGMDVALIDPREQLGGVCLHEGCIPSKTYLYLAELLLDARRVGRMGLHFSEPTINLSELRGWKDEVIGNMSGGLRALSDKRNIQRIRGVASFEDGTSLRLEHSEISRLRFKQAIIATGSTPIPFPGTEVNAVNAGNAGGAQGRIMLSSDALQLAEVPRRMLIIGGGYVGLELGTVYAALGCEVHLAELADRILPGVDHDLVQPLQRRLKELFAEMHLSSRIQSLAEGAASVLVTMETPGGTMQADYDRVLVAMGRRPASQNLGLDLAGVTTDERGFIRVDEQQRTSRDNIFAVGDVAGGMMLAHTATREGRVAAEVIAGEASAFDVRAIPAVVYTDPQIAWCGLSEERARAENIPVAIEKFPWKYSGRANTMGMTDGLTKIIASPDNGRVLGIGACGRGAEGLIAEGVLAIEMGALAEDIALSLHPHPTLSETEGEAAEIFMGSPTHLLPRKKG